jgi:hypothetical protein
MIGSDRMTNTRATERRPLPKLPTVADPKCIWCLGYGFYFEIMGAMWELLPVVCHCRAR